MKTEELNIFALYISVKMLQRLCHREVFPDLVSLCCSPDQRCDEGVQRRVRAAVRGRPLQQRPL